MLARNVSALPPGTPMATRERHGIEHLVMVAVKRGGRREGEAVVDWLGGVMAYIERQARG